MDHCHPVAFGFLEVHMMSVSLRAICLIAGLNLSLFMLLFLLPLEELRADDTPSDKNGTAKRPSITPQKTNKAAKAEAKSIELFAAMDQGLLNVNFIGKDATEANLIFKNNGPDPLNIILPTTFGAVPVLAQGLGGVGGGLGGGGLGGGGLGGAGGGGFGGGGQGVGGGFGGGGGGLGGGGGGFGGVGGGGGGLFRVEPDRPRKMTVATVCLNHGKADPNPRMKYKLVRLAEVNDSPVVEGICLGLATGKVSQKVAQAAAWHFANGLTWDELLHKPRVVSEYTGIELFFSKLEVQAAMRLVAMASAEAESLSQSKSKYESYSEPRNAMTNSSK